MIGFRFGRRFQDRRRFLRRVGTFAGYLGFLLRGPFRRNAPPLSKLFECRFLVHSIIAPAVRLRLIEQRSDIDPARISLYEA